MLLVRFQWCRVRAAMMHRLQPIAIVCALWIVLPHSTREDAKPSVINFPSHHHTVKVVRKTSSQRD